MPRLARKVAIVTGAAQGIGEAIATRFADEGASVVLLDVDSAKGSAVASRISARDGVASFVEGDVASSSDARRAVAEAAERYGALHIVVNNAAVVTKGTATTLSEADWDTTLDVNLKGAFLVSKSAIPVIASSGGGVIINMSSITGLVGRSERVAYCASKGGMIALSRAMATDHATDGVRVVAICPSGIRTRQMDDVHAEAADPAAGLAETLALHPVGRMADPEELAGLTAYLASDEASFITGAVYTFDGGYTATRLPTILQSVSARSGEKTRRGGNGSSE
jgi:NAD(P)-dependent dehydrogenase (short-subunit alcohol dehydrogenase family)